MAEIRIVTEDGDARTTSIFLNGERIDRVIEFQFSVRVGRRCSAQIVFFDPAKGKKDFKKYYGEDFKKLDELKGRYGGKEPEEYVGSAARSEDSAETVGSDFQQGDKGGQDRGTVL